jgi:hypothetical protein
MKYIITENQYKLLTEQEDILRIPLAAFDNNWNDLQLFLERRGNPPYEITDDLDLYISNIKSLGNLTSVGGNLNLEDSNVESLGNLTSVGGYLDLRDTPLSKKYTEKEIRSMAEVGGEVYL